MKHTFWIVLLAAWVSVTLVSVAWTQTKPEERFKGQTLIVTTWSGPYEKNFRATLVEPFEKQYGVKIDLVPGWGEFITKIQTAPKGQPPYDVFLATDRTYLQAKTSGHLEKMRPENLPNLNRIWDRLKRLDGVTAGLGAPFDSAYMAMTFRSDLIKFTPTSWKDFARPELKNLLSLDQLFYYNLYVGGYVADRVDKNGRVVLDPIDPIYNKMKEIAASSLYKWYESGAEFMSLLEREEIHGGYYWSGTLYAKKTGGMKLAIVLPKEGTVAYIDYLCVLKDSPKRDLAEFFINYCLGEDAMTRFVDTQKNSVSNKYARVPAELKGIVLGSEAEWEKIDLINWDYILPNWKTLEERWKKEVLPAVKR